MTTLRPEKIDRIIERIDKEKLISLTSELVRIPSHKEVEGGGEKDVNRYISKWLTSNGFNVTEVDIKGVPVPIAKVGGRKQENALLLNGHSDTAGVDYMKNPFSGECNDGFICGRGTTDMKGALASMATALKIFKNNFNSSTDIYFFPSTREETGECPSSNLLSRSLPAKYCIVGEPTNLHLAARNKGLYFFRLASKGKPAHLSTPEKGVNAIDNLISSINTINDSYFNDRMRETNNESLFVLCEIKGGSEGIPDYAEALYNRRTVVGDSYANDKRNIKHALKKAKQNNPSLSIQVKHYRGYEKEFLPMEEPHDHEFVERSYNALRPLGSELTAFPGWTEGSIFRSNGIDTLIFGPGDVSDAHTPNEKLSVYQLQKSCEGYLRLMIEHHNAFETNKHITN